MDTTTCDICGAAVADPDAHAAWHQEMDKARDDSAEGDIVGGRP